jgi:HEXXH motif-containing protein
MHGLIARVPSCLTWTAGCGLPAELRPPMWHDDIEIDPEGETKAPSPMDRAAVYDTADTAGLVVLFQDVVDTLAAMNVAASNLLRHALQTVLLRKVADQGSFASSSWPDRPGVIGIVNAHRPDLVREWLIDALVHESIHSLLYLIEAREPFYLSSDARQACIARSPWSGRSLSLHSYVHACFVWFGLWNFWHQAPRSCQTTVARTRLEDRARRGFRPRLLSALADGESLVAPAVHCAVTEMEDTVLEG